MIRRRALGVDFSGARDAGRRIWIAEGFLENGTLRIESCFQARDLPGSGDARDAALPALVEFLAGSGDAIAGLDFPFSLPASLVPEKTWIGFVTAFSKRYPDAETFRAACMAAGGGRELKRRTDVAARTPFSAYNLRIYRQTYEGIRNLLGPLLAADLARAIPMQTPAAGRPVLAEACPASLLKAEGLYGSYKGRGSNLAAARDGILRGLTARGLVSLRSRRLRARVVEDQGGDALDAIVAACAAARATRDETATRVADAIEAIETRVFF